MHGREETTVACEPTYVLYSGEDVVDIGTAEEIASRRGVKAETVRWYATPRGSKRGKLHAVKVDDSE